MKKSQQIRDLIWATLTKGFASKHVWCSKNIYEITGSDLTIRGVSYMTSLDEGLPEDSIRPEEIFWGVDRVKGLILTLEIK